MGSRTKPRRAAQHRAPGVRQAAPVAETTTHVPGQLQLPGEGAALRALLELEQVHARLVGLQRQQDELVRRALNSGASFGTVGRLLGVTRQAVRQRYGVPAGH